jgi:hypothetical protein
VKDASTDATNASVAAGSAPRRGGRRADDEDAYDGVID